MKGIEKAEALVAKAEEELDVIQKRKAEILDKEKTALKNLEEAKNYLILQVVSSYKLDGSELKKMLARNAHITETKPYNTERTSINEERNNDENEKND